MSLLPVGAVKPTCTPNTPEAMAGAKAGAIRMTPAGANCIQAMAHIHQERRGKGAWLLG